MKWDPAKILGDTFQYKTIPSTTGGDLLSLPAKDAFTFVNCVNGLSGDSFYFDAAKQPIRPIINPSLSDPGVLDYSRNYPHVFQGDKILVPFAYNKTMERRHQLIPGILNLLDTNELPPTSCIILLNHPGNTGFGEAFWEYIAILLLAREGFLVENQLRYTDINGYPDLGAYYLPDIQAILKKHDLLDEGGYMGDLAVLRVLGKVETKERHTPCFQTDTCIMGEVKVKFPGQMGYTNQVWKYTQTGCFDRILQVTPGIDRLRDSYDYLKSDVPAEIQWSTCPPVEMTDSKAREQFKLEIAQTVKQYLLKNLTLRELILLDEQYYKNRATTIIQLFESLTRLDLDTICEFVKKFIKH